MIQLLFLASVCIFCARLEAATHIFWYKAIERGYNLQSSNPGPAIPAGAVLHQGMIASGSVDQNTKTATSVQGAFGGGLDDAQGRCSFFWFKELDAAAGVASNAILRGELKDGWCGSALCNEGPIKIRCGVVSFQNNLNTWGGADFVPDNTDWMDFINPLGSGMGYDYSNQSLGAEEVINFTAATGRPGGTSPSILDGKFFEIDVTDQVNYMLMNGGSQAIVLLVTIGEGSTGKVTAYADEAGKSATGTCQSDHPWTPDGNTLHLWLESANLSFPGADSTPPVISNIQVSLAAHSAAVTWTTNEIATSKIIYGTSGGYSLSQSVSGYRTSHTLTLSNLSLATRYNAKAVSFDPTGNSDTSAIFYFTTPSTPVFTTTPLNVDTTALEDSLYTVQLSASDPDSGDVLTYSLVTRPAGMTVAPSTGTISWIPTRYQVGRYPVAARVSDSYGFADTLSYYVTAANTNHPPMITSTNPSNDSQVLEGDTLVISVTATDPNAGDVLSYAWFRNGAPAGSGSALVLGTGPLSAGVDTVRVVVSDGEFSVEKDWRITIFNRSFPPKILFPAKGKVVTADSLIGWEPSPDLEILTPQFFRIQFSKSSSFTDILLEESGFLATSLHLRDINGIAALPSGFIIFWRVMAYDTAGYDTPYSSAANYFVYLGAIGVENVLSGPMPDVFSLGAATPNPIRSNSRVEYAVPPGLRSVSIQLFDVRGHWVQTLIQKRVAPGFHRVNLNGTGLSAGIYLLRMEAEKFSQTRALVIIK